MSKTKLDVRYINPQHDIDVELDQEIVKFFNSLGFYWCEDAIDLVGSFGRSIGFQKEQKD